MNAEPNVLNNPIVWYTLAVVIFLALFYRSGRKPLLAWLDSEIAKVKNELDQAKKLRAEAEIALAGYQKRQKAALQEAESILVHAQQEAAALRTAAEAELKLNLQRREQQAMDRIRMAEADALAALRNATIEQSMALACAKFASGNDAAQTERLADQAIAELPVLAAGKANAA